MNEKQIEKEVQSRVDFKMRELLKGVKNVASVNWHIAFQKGSQKHSNYWEAFEEMEKMLLKEMNMAVPYSDMDVRNRKNARDKSVDKIVDYFNLLSDRNFHQKVKLIVSAIEESQIY